MMAKITKGSSFGGCVRYVLTKKDARLIAANGVLVGTHKVIAQSMEDQAQMNPRLGKTVGHISLNFSSQDREKVDNAFMVKVAGEYMQKMGIKDTQFIIVRHNDREHPHCHIVFNRVSNSGKTISDQKDRHRSVKACRALTEKYGLYLKTNDAKQDVKREQLRGPDKVKYEIHDTIKSALPLCSNWNQLEKRLERQGVSVTYKYKGGTNQKEGVIFSKDGQSFNGSKVDRQYSFSKLDAALSANAHKIESRQTANVATVKVRQEPSQQNSPRSDNSHHHSYTTGSALSGWININPGPVVEDEDPLRLRRKKKKKKGVSR